MKYIEYEISTGRILSEITSQEEPEVSLGIGLLSVNDDEEINLSMYSVRNGALVKTSETNQERLERERIRREHGEQCRHRLRSMMTEFVVAMLAEDDEEINNLRREYRMMKAYL